MSDLSPSQQRRVDGICRHIEEYLTLRFAHAERVNQKIGHFVDDLKAQLLVNLREVLIKGKAWGAEKAITLLGGQLRRVVHVELPGLPEDRSLVVIQKVSPTPESYPRRPGIPKKRPLGK